MILDAETEELAGMLALEVQIRVAEAVVTSQSTCAERGRPLTEQSFEDKIREAKLHEGDA